MGAKRKTDSISTERRTRTEIPGIVADARALGVSRVHLWMVLNGRRESAPLLARYAALKRSEGVAS